MADVALPAPTTESAATRWAADRRHDWAAILDSCRQADSIAPALAALDGTTATRAVAALRVLTLLETVPSVGGKVAARRLLRRVGVDELATVGEVDDDLWRDLEVR